MAILPITNVVNVTITNTPSGLTQRNVNSLGLFTTETPNNSNAYGIYVSASQVAADYGTNSITAAMASAVFSQSPNILSGNGQLVIMPLQAAVSATSGTFTTSSLTSNLTALYAVTSGDLKVTIDGTVQNITGINFAGAASINDIATILQTYISNAIVSVAGSTLVFTSKAFGTVSTVALAAVSGGTGTNLAGSGYLNSAGGTAVAGANSSGETILAAIARTITQVGYVGVITNLNLEDAALVTIAAGVQALDNIFLHQVSSSNSTAAASIKSATDTHTRILFYSISASTANLMKAAYAGRAFSVDFTGSFTSSTMNLKALATILPDTGVSQTLYNTNSTNGADMYVSYDGVPSVVSTGGNDYFDNIYANLALKFALETAGFNYLRQTNTKVPQTEQGMNGLKSAYALIMEQYVGNGSLAAGAWNSSETFGNPEIFKQNILTRGYYIYSLPIVQQNSVDRNARKAPLCQIAAKRAGALQSSNVLVIINN